MKNILYRKILIPATESEDGDSPTTVFVTEEVNFIGVWCSSYGGVYILKAYSMLQRYTAIEDAVRTEMQDLDNYKSVPMKF